jgi:tetratricopeptide (TPR) repeat protein
LRLGISSTGRKKEVPQGLENEVVNLFNQGKFQIVVQRVKQILGSFPNSYTLWSLLGASYVELKQFNEAIDCCKRSLMLNPKNPDPYYNMGTAATALGQDDKAILNYKRAISINKNHFFSI